MEKIKEILKNIGVIILGGIFTTIYIAAGIAVFMAVMYMLYFIYLFISMLGLVTLVTAVLVWGGVILATLFFGLVFYVMGEEVLDKYPMVLDDIKRRFNRGINMEKRLRDMVKGKKSRNKSPRIVEVSNVVQYDTMGYPLHLCIFDDGEQRWIDTSNRDDDVELIWRKVN